MDWTGEVVGGIRNHSGTRCCFLSILSARSLPKSVSPSGYRVYLIWIIYANRLKFFAFVAVKLRRLHQDLLYRLRLIWQATVHVSSQSLEDTSAITIPRHCRVIVNIRKRFCSVRVWLLFNPLMGILKPQSNGPSYSNMVLVHWPLMGGLLHLVQRGGAWAGWDPAQYPPRCTKCNTQPIKGQCTDFILFDMAI